MMRKLIISVVIIALFFTVSCFRKKDPDNYQKCLDKFYGPVLENGATEDEAAFAVSELCKPCETESQGDKCKELLEKPVDYWLGPVAE